MIDEGAAVAGPGGDGVVGVRDGDIVGRLGEVGGAAAGDVVAVDWGHDGGWRGGK